MCNAYNNNILPVRTYLHMCYAKKKILFVLSLSFFQLLQNQITKFSRCNFFEKIIKSKFEKKFHHCAPTLIRRCSLIFVRLLYIFLFCRYCGCCCCCCCYLCCCVLLVLLLLNTHNKMRLFTFTNVYLLFGLLTMFYWSAYSSTCRI